MKEIFIIYERDWGSIGISFDTKKEAENFVKAYAYTNYDYYFKKLSVYENVEEYFKNNKNKMIELLKGSIYNLENDNVINIKLDNKRIFTCSLNYLKNIVEIEKKLPIAVYIEDKEIKFKKSDFIEFQKQYEIEIKRLDVLKQQLNKLKTNKKDNKNLTK